MMDGWRGLEGFFHARPGLPEQGRGHSAPGWEAEDLGLLFSPSPAAFPGGAGERLPQSRHWSTGLKALQGNGWKTAGRPSFPMDW